MNLHALQFLIPRISSVVHRLNVIVRIIQVLKTDKVHDLALKDIIHQQEEAQRDDAEQRGSRRCQPVL